MWYPFSDFIYLLLKSVYFFKKFEYNYYIINQKNKEGSK
jgi:hypothetical protein